MERPKRGASRADAAKAAVAAAALGGVAGKTRFESYELAKEAAVYDEVSVPAAPSPLRAATPPRARRPALLAPVRAAQPRLTRGCGRWTRRSTGSW